MINTNFQNFNNDFSCQTSFEVKLVKDIKLWVFPLPFLFLYSHSKVEMLTLPGFPLVHIAIESLGICEK